MRSFRQFVREQVGQFSYGGKTTDNFDICPSALEAFETNADEGDFESEDDFMSAVEAVDRYLGLEKQLMDQGSADEEDVEAMSDLVSLAIEAIAEAGLEGHDYHEIHLDAVEELADS